MHRKVFEVDGVAWSVFDVIPEWTPNLDPELLNGWLCFESDAERRRLHPIPPDWERGTYEELAELLAAAAHVGEPWRRPVE